MDSSLVQYFALWVPSVWDQRQQGLKPFIRDEIRVENLKNFTRMGNVAFGGCRKEATTFQSGISWLKAILSLAIAIVQSYTPHIFLWRQIILRWQPGYGANTRESHLDWCALRINHIRVRFRLSRRCWHISNRTAGISQNSDRKNAITYCATMDHSKYLFDLV